MAGRSLNKVMLLGHAGKDTEMSYAPSGMAIAKFSLATNDRRKDKSGEWTDVTEWHNIVAFDKIAETCNQYVKKGKQVYIEGKIQTRKYDDKDGQTKYFTEIICNDLILLGGGDGQRQGGGGSYQSSGSSNYGGGSRQAPSAPSLPEPDFEPAPADDLPF